jgi:hypothetical protein
MNPSSADVRHVINSLAMAVDVAQFSRSLGYELDPWQLDVINKAEQNRNIMVLASRQSGKSFCAALYSLWVALHKRVTVLIVSPSQRQSALLFSTILELYRQCGRPIPSDAERLLSLELANGSKIYSLPGVEHSIRGYRADLVILDECAWIDDDVYAAVRPFVALGGHILAIGTPHGRRGWWWKAWSESEDFYKTVIRADQCPRIPAEFLEEERRNLGNWWFESEYMCVFGQNIDSVFDSELVDDAFSDDISAWNLDDDADMDNHDDEDDTTTPWDLDEEEGE